MTVVRRPALRIFAWSLAGVAVCLLAWMPAATAEHDQAGLSFDSKGGNQWWVEVQLGGNYQYYGLPEVRDTDGAWKFMDQPSWAGPGQYATSYHVEPGHDVKFRVSYRGSTVGSCWFKHPAGIEACDGSETFNATFIPRFVAGSASDRIGVKVVGNQPVAGVSWVTQAYWTNAMQRQADGTWASTVARAPDGIALQFLAYSDDTRTFKESGCFRWPSGAAIDCPQGPTAFASFPHSPDGEWSHLDVNAYDSDDGGAVRLVEVRFDGSDFRAMQRTEETQFSSVWSLRDAPATGDHVMQFRVTDAQGRINCPQDGYNWPDDEQSSLYGETGRIRFEEMKGSTSWVQTNAYSWTPIVAVGVVLPDGSERTMAKQSYCDWAAQIDIAAGTQVRFVGYFPDLTHQMSAPMAWPPGSSPPPPPPPPPGFSAQFTLVTGNEWWIQTQVTPTGGTVSKVDVRLNGGDWKPLKLQSWGVRAYAASYHAPQGTIVQFQATSTTWATAQSSCYQWIPPQQNGETAHEVACGSQPPPPPPPPPGTFQATFSNVRGNEWWVEADVKVTGGTLAKVEAREDGGAWIALAKQSYGSWAKSFHVEPGHKVEFRATSTAGDTSMSAAYTWKNPYP